MHTFYYCEVCSRTNQSIGPIDQRKCKACRDGSPVAIMGLPDWYEDRAPEIARTDMLMLATAKSDLEPTLEIAQAYQRLYDYFNTEVFLKVFNQKLPLCVLNLSRKRGAAAFFQPNAWIDPMTGEALDEISLVPEWTGRSPVEVLSTLVHEMAHQKDHLQGTAAKNGYHSQTWAKIMLRIGLPEQVRSTSRIKVSHTIEEEGAYAIAFRNMPKTMLLPFQTANPMHNFIGKPKSDTSQGKRSKYQCPVCGDNVRGKSGLAIHCKSCAEDFHEIGF